jgi:hypothetical protein
VFAVLFVLFLFVMCICLIYRYSRSGTLNLQPDLGKPNRPKPGQARLWEALRSVPGHVTKRKHGAIYFWTEARMDPFAEAPIMS